tara:strand:+ start:689 stop:1399 length:711 start_codon:yes stop_codon:yes gene_type:complete
MSEEVRVSRAAEFYSVESEFDKKLIEYRFRTLEPYLTGKSCLELGPGSGYMTSMLSDSFPTLTVVEGSQQLLDELPDIPNVRKVCSLFEDFEPDEKFDSVVLEHVLEHVDEPLELLSRAKLWLKESGRLFVGVPNANSLHRLVAEEMGLLSSKFDLNERDINFGHRRVYDLKSLSESINAVGLKIVKTEGVFLKPLSNGQINEHWSVEMWDGFYRVGRHYPELCAELLCVCEISRV